MPSLKERWKADVTALSGSDAAKISAFDEIIAAYSQPQRRYHGLGHLEALFALLEQHAQAVTLPLPLHFSVWWHDVVYDPQAADNEPRSAALACTRLTELGAAPEVIERVNALILATSDHWEAPTMDDGDYFLDADIAILGAPPSVYDQYAEDVRTEYAFASEAMYRVGRSSFLSKAIQRPRLFRKPEFKSVYEETARANLRRELARLS